MKRFLFVNVIILCIFVATVFCCSLNRKGLFVCSNMTRESLSNILPKIITNRLKIDHVNITNLNNELFTNSMNYVSNLTIKDCNISSIEKGSFKKFINLEYLYITDNNLIQLNGDFLSSLDELIQLDLSNNNIQHLNVTYNSQYFNTIILNNNNLTSLRKNNFYIECQYLTKLQIRNSRIKYFEAGILNKLPGLLVLDLSNNNLQKIETEIFVGLSQLQELNLQQNSIKYLAKNTFQQLKSLRKLDLSNLNIEILESEAFSGLINMTELYLQKNNISNITKETFNGLTNLQILDLSSNNIRILNRHLFENVPNIIGLNLGNNKILQLPCKLFNIKNKLDQLDLSNNEIEEILICAFESLRQLSDLNLHQNNLSHLKIGTFSGLHQLKYLNLSNNKINHLDENVIVPVENLENLDLSANQFKNLDPVYLLDHLKSLRQIDLSGNIWDCYNLSSATKYLQSRHIRYESKILNYEQENIGGIQCFTNLTDADLQNNTLHLPNTTKHNEKMDERYDQQITEMRKSIENYFQQVVNENQNLPRSQHNQQMVNQNLLQQIIVELRNLPKALQETLNTHSPMNKSNANEMISKILVVHKQQEDGQTQNDIVNELRNGINQIAVILIVGICCVVIIFIYISYKSYKSNKTDKTDSNMNITCKYSIGKYYTLKELS